MRAIFISMRATNFSSNKIMPHYIMNRMENDHKDVGKKYYNQHSKINKLIN